MELVKNTSIYLYVRSQKQEWVISYLDYDFSKPLQILVRSDKLRKDTCNVIVFDACGLRCIRCV